MIALSRTMEKLIKRKNSCPLKTEQFFFNEQIVILAAQCSVNFELYLTDMMCHCLICLLFSFNWVRKCAPGYVTLLP
jgi:hypothetical protein